MTFCNILIVRADRMGDVVLTVPSMRAIKRAFPSARVSVWLDASTRPLIEGLPFVDEIFVEDKSRGWFGFIDLVGRIRARRFDLAVIYHTKRRTNAACALAGIPCRLGYKNSKNGWLLTHPVEDRRHLGEKHEAEYCLDLLRRIGVTDNDLSLEIARDPWSEKWADEIVGHALSGDPFLVIHPAASCPTRCWPAASFAALIDLLAERKMRIVLAGAPNSSPCARDICSRTAYPVVDMTGKTTLSQMVSLFRRAKAVVSNDSGPVHVAAAAGIPVVSIFLRRQPGINPERWRPLGARSRIVVPPSGQEIVVDRHSHVVSGAFDAITPRQVIEALSPLI